MDSATQLVIDPELLERFGGRGPRYTSYPTADRFHPGFTDADYLEALRARADRRDEPLGLYFHIPFCRTICYYCGCNKIGTKHQGKSAEYLTALEREIELVTDAIGMGQTIRHLHFGGGTPTFMLDSEFEQLFAVVRKHFVMAPDGEYSIEVDPRTVTPDRLKVLRGFGLNRISLGIQDFDTDVQRAVNRIQSYEESRALMEAARDEGFESVNVDLIYGLPLQTVEGFRKTVELTIAARPDRVALYHYAHLPKLFMPQRRIDEAQLPDAATRGALFEMASRLFGEAGYVHLGLDHFALANDELAVAQRENRLHRNFQGYCSHDAGDIIALGVSSISQVGAVYAQNDKTLSGYYQRLAENRLPTVRGIKLSEDDFLRRDAIQALMCGFALDWASYDSHHPVKGREYFADALASLAPMSEAGAITIDDAGIEVEPRGRLLVRAVAMAFDRYLRESPPSGTYSKIA